MAALKRTVDTEIAQTQNLGEDVPSDAFCEQVAVELDNIQQDLLTAARARFPEGNEKEASPRQLELQAKVDEYLKASQVGFSKVPLHISVVCAPSCSPAHLFTRRNFNVSTHRPTVSPPLIAWFWESIRLACMVNPELYKELARDLRRDPVLRQSFKEARTHDAKEAKRREWSGYRAKETQMELEALETLTLEEHSNATWYTFKRIAVELGNDVQGAKNYCQSCLELGKTEFRINVFT